MMGRWSPQDWALQFVAVADGRVIGTQALDGRDFAVLREVGTGSWLGREFHGQGYGTEMRAAVLHLAFDGLARGVRDLGGVRRQRRVVRGVAQARLRRRRQSSGTSSAASRSVGRRLRLDRAGWAAARTVDGDGRGS